MIGLAGRRSVLARTKALSSSAIPARATLAIAAQSPSLSSSRAFHATACNEEEKRRVWAGRVKTAWIDALNESREVAKGAKEGVKPPAVKPDVTPKKMSDSYYSAVCIFNYHRLRSPRPI